MFDNFGNFNSYEEINMSAEGMFNEGDFEGIKVLAKENGLEPEDAELYINGETICLCVDAGTAAIGKLEVEAAEMKIDELMRDWVDYIESLCFYSEEVSRNVRKSEKSLEGCIAALLKWSFGHQHDINDKIKKAAGVNASKVTFGIPGMNTAKKIIREYYGG